MTVVLVRDDDRAPALEHRAESVRGLRPAACRECRSSLREVLGILAVHGPILPAESQAPVV